MVWNEPGKDKDPWNSGNRPADLEQMVKNLQRRLGALFGGKGGGRRGFQAGSLLWLIPVIVAAWLVSGFYTVAGNDRGINYLFGRYTGTTQAGLHWHFPWPMGRMQIISGLGSRTYTRSYNRLLTGDGSVVTVEATVNYHVADVPRYLFNTANPGQVPGAADSGVQMLLNSLADSAIRDTVAQSKLADMLGNGREKAETGALQLLSTALGRYDTGLAVTRLVFQKVAVPDAVSAAYAEVRKARESSRQARNDAQVYADELVPQSRDEAAVKLREAETYKSTLIIRAQGDTARFEEILAAYRRAPALTRDELYFHTMEEVLGNVKKVVVDASSGRVSVYIGEPFSTPLPTRAPPASGDNKPPAPPARATTAAPAASTANSGKGGA